DVQDVDPEHSPQDFRGKPRIEEAHHGVLRGPGEQGRPGRIPALQVIGDVPAIANALLPILDDGNGPQLTGKCRSNLGKTTRRGAYWRASSSRQPSMVRASPLRITISGGSNSSSSALTTLTCACGCCASAGHAARSVRSAALR